MTRYEGINRRELFGLAGAATAVAAVSLNSDATAAVAVADTVQQAFIDQGGSCLSCGGARRGRTRVNID
ncbi:hypothetical protein [Actinomycetospora flava]|uniref:Twin-arginine translocation signal domain-containing protein n=1 Tax=Actinomycetospora flava TaxID=3129232 RepID=A0ABU8MC70_9PSEU